MNKQYFGHCDACGKPLATRHFTFNRHVEQYHYGQGATDEDMSCEVLSAETLATYCNAECAWPAMLAALAERGIKCTGGGAGPIEACSKCGGPVVMSQPHVAYIVHDETEVRKPWLTEARVHSAEGLADVCVRCDGDVAADAANLPEAIEFGLHEIAEIQCR